MAISKSLAELYNFTILTPPNLVQRFHVSGLIQKFTKLKSFSVNICFKTYILFRNGTQTSPLTFQFYLQITRMLLLKEPAKEFP